MAQLVKRTGLSKRVGNALSGQQILESLVAIADEADRRFTPKHLYEFWEPYGSGSYQRFVKDIVAGLGLNESLPPYEREPFSGYNTFVQAKKRTVTRLFPYLHLIDAPSLDKMADDEEVLLISYYFWHLTNDSSSYFYKGHVSRLHEWYLRLKGMKEASEVEDEIAKILKPHQIRSSETPLKLFVDRPFDLFEYQKRLFTLPQDRDNYQQNEGGWTNVIWAIGLFENASEPIGYILFNEKVKEGKKLFLPSAQ